MNVIVVLDNTSAEGLRPKPGDAVWLVDTPSNRKWMDQARAGLDPNSAVFRCEAGEENESTAARVLFSIFDHHPLWDQIEVFGARLTPALAEILPDTEASEIKATPGGLTLYRRSRPSST